MVLLQNKRWTLFTFHLFFIKTKFCFEFFWLVKTDAAAAAKSLQLCLTLCDPIDGSPPGSPVPGILQARTLEWAAISFSNSWKWKVTVKSLRPVRLLVTSWTAAHQAPPSTGFSRQECWSGVPLPSWSRLYTCIQITQNKLDESQIHFTKQEKPNLNGYGLYDSTYITFYRR